MLLTFGSVATSPRKGTTGNDVAGIQPVPMLAICWPRALISATALAALATALTLVLTLADVPTATAQSGGADAGGNTDAAPPPYDEAAAQDIDRMLMCPVCPAQTIDQTEVTLAQQMRAQVRELLAAGASREEVLTWFRERYGPSIVAEPPRSGINLIAWLVPGAALVIAMAGGILVLRAMRRASPSDGTAAAAIVSPSESETDDLQPWLDAVDRDLAQHTGSPPTITKDDNDG